MPRYRGWEISEDSLKPLSAHERMELESLDNNTQYDDAFVIAKALDLASNYQLYIPESFPTEIFKEKILKELPLLYPGVEFRLEGLTISWTGGPLTYAIFQAMRYVCPLKYDLQPLSVHSSGRLAPRDPDMPWLLTYTLFELEREAVDKEDKMNDRRQFLVELIEDAAFRSPNGITEAYLEEILSCAEKFEIDLSTLARWPLNDRNLFLLAEGRVHLSAHCAKLIRRALALHFETVEAGHLPAEISAEYPDVSSEVLEVAHFFFGDDLSKYEEFLAQAKLSLFYGAARDEFVKAHSVPKNLLPYLDGSEISAWFESRFRSVRVGTSQVYWPQDTCPQFPDDE